MGFKIECYSEIDIGLKRQTNQDSMLVDLDDYIFAVADGLGGHVAGEVASSLSIDSLHCFLKQHIQNQKDSLNVQSLQNLTKAGFEKANKDVFNQSMNHVQLRGMGTTLVTTWIHNGHVVIGNVGDSRVYLYRDQNLWQLTDDHSLCMAESKLGFHYQDKLEKQKRSHLIQSVGLSLKLNIDILTRTAVEGDIYLLCSDGLHGMIEDSEIADVFRSEELSDIAKKCMIKALCAGGWDNISIILVKITSV